MRIEASEPKFGDLFKAWRIAKGFDSPQELAQKTNVSLDKINRIENCLSFLEPISDDDPLGQLTVLDVHSISEALELDVNVLEDEGKLKQAKTTSEILETLEPGGLGTYEQRVVRLVNHGQITLRRGCEILGINKPPYELPSVKDTGCTCPSCRKIEP